MLTSRTPRVVAARKLTRPSGRAAAGRFLAEGPQPVGGALAGRSRTTVHEIFASVAALHRYDDLIAAARAAGVRVSTVADDAMAGLSDTVTPPGLVAVCDPVDVPLPVALEAAPRLVAVLAEVRDPGNAGTALRTADAAGAGAVVFAGDCVDPYNGKCVRASAGSLFHVPVVRAASLLDTIGALQAAGLQVLAADVGGDADLGQLVDRRALDAPTAWVFGSESHGLPTSAATAADARVRIPLMGRAESLNLGAAVAVCLYASALAHRSGSSRR
ncbi:MAG: RNA methyltransferase [Actinomycetota bacterium]|nr:RNA methyltransferase [Actinomycetota bacterium]